jgi:DNA-binding NtrC family response regulator
MHEKILVVDDDKDMCGMISTILEEEGYRIDKAYNGKQAIEKISTKGYDLTILDYKLPDMDGIDVLKEVHKARPSLKTIMISAYGSPSVRSMAKKLGVYRFLDKPFDLNRLVQVVRKALAKSQGEVDRSSPPLSSGTVPDLRTERSEDVESGLSPSPKSGIYNTDGTDERYELHGYNKIQF